MNYCRWKDFGRAHTIEVKNTNEDEILEFIERDDLVGQFCILKIGDYVRYARFSDIKVAVMFILYFGGSILSKSSPK
jgi:hypothetical protein